MTIQRDQQWLEQRFLHVWERGFSDVIPGNTIVVKYGQRAKTRLGSIRMSRDEKVSTVLINRLFQLEEVPLEVIDATIAHELCHYVHGFSSPFEQKFRTPHAGGVVTKELRVRGFEKERLFQEKWTRQHWSDLVRAHAPARKRRRVRRKRRPMSFSRVLSRLLSL